jgi:microcystin-dependent protein
VANPYLGEIRFFAFLFAPRGWAFCNGQTLPISQNEALFDLLGTTYGGNGTSNFKLPNLQSRVVIGQGEGAGLSSYDLGEVGGSETETLTSSQMPVHNHMVQASDKKGSSNLAAGNVLALGKKDEFATTPDGTIMNSAMITNAGGGDPVSIVQPYLVLNPCISLQGIFPSQS